MKTAPRRKDRLPRVLVSDGLEIDSINDLVELKLGELIVLVAIGVVLCKELLGLRVTTLFDCTECMAGVSYCGAVVRGTRVG